MTEVAYALCMLLPTIAFLLLPTVAGFLIIHGRRRYLAHRYARESFPRATAKLGKSR